MSENETEHLYEVNVHPSGPSEPDEMDVLADLYKYDKATGLYTFPLYEEED